MRRMWFQLGCLSAGVGVLLGAFGAHSLKDKVPEASLKTWETASHYQFIHALGLIVVALAPQESRLAGWSLLFGTALFSGSLYALVLTQVKKLGMITPFGGIAFVVGWVALAFQGFPSGSA